MVSLTGYDDALQLSFNLCLPAVTQTWYILVFNGRSDTMSFTYVTFFAFRIDHGWMEKKVFVTLITLYLTPCASHSKSFPAPYIIFLHWGL